MDVVVIGRTCPDTHTGEFLSIDLLDKAATSSAIAHAHATHLIHLAWYVEHGIYWTSPLNQRWQEASVQLANAFCEAGGKKLVMAGTCAEYGSYSGYCHEDKTPLSPTTLYGKTKDAARREIRTICGSHNVPLIWGRIFIPYGKGENPQRLIPSLIDVFQGRREAFGVNAAALRDFLHVSDVARGFTYLLHHAEQGDYNIASGIPTKITDLVSRIAHDFDCDPSPTLERSFNKFDEPELLIGDNQKLLNLGWGIEHPIEKMQWREYANEQ